LAIILMIVSISSLGCEEEEPEEANPTGRMELSSTLVPDIDLDMYVYIRQDNPTAVLKDIINVPIDINVVSMAVWGVDNEENYAFGGGLEFTSLIESGEMHGKISGTTDIWTSLSHEMIYFTHGSGAAVDTLKSAISAKNFKYFDNEIALAEMSLFPDSDSMNLVGLAVARPGPILIDVIVRNTTPDISELLEVLIHTANLQIVTAGIYSQNQIDVSTIIANPELTNILVSQVGILASAKSEWLGVLVGPIMRQVLGTAGYEYTELDECTVYKSYLDLGLAQDIPVLFRIEDNRLYVAVSLQDSYATLLITNIAK
jgi:hypothetical protein